MTSRAGSETAISNQQSPLSDRPTDWLSELSGLSELSELSELSTLHTRRSYSSARVAYLLASKIKNNQDHQQA